MHMSRLLSLYTGRTATVGVVCVSLIGDVHEWRAHACVSVRDVHEWLVNAYIDTLHGQSTGFLYQLEKTLNTPLQTTVLVN